MDQWRNKPELHIGQEKGYLYNTFLFLCYISVSKCVDMLIALKKNCVKRRPTNLCCFQSKCKRHYLVSISLKAWDPFCWGPFIAKQQIQYVHNGVTVASCSFYNETNLLIAVFFLLFFCLFSKCNRVDSFIYLVQCIMVAKNKLQTRVCDLSML